MHQLKNIKVFFISAFIKKQIIKILDYAYKNIFLKNNNINTYKLNKWLKKCTKIKSHPLIDRKKINFKYVVKIKGKIDIKKLKNLEKGITIKGTKYKSIKVSILEKNKESTKIEMALMEGKNREIRKIISFLGGRVNKLQRISYGPIQLNKLKKNEIEEININKYFKKIP